MAAGNITYGITQNGAKVIMDALNDYMSCLLNGWAEVKFENLAINSYAKGTEIEKQLKALASELGVQKKVCMKDLAVLQRTLNTALTNYAKQDTTASANLKASAASKLSQKS